jgi:hypothetical protein
MTKASRNTDSWRSLGEVAAEVVAKVKPVYRLRIQHTDSDHDSIRHLRAVLKVLLRRYRFRCLSIERESAL